MNTIPVLDVDDTPRPPRSMSESTTSSPRPERDSSESIATPCFYCVNLDEIRGILPPKRCAYCNELKCQFCTLRFPLLHGKKELPKALKSNSRICRQCFHHHWQTSHPKRATCDLDDKTSTKPPMYGITRHLSLPDTNDCSGFDEDKTMTGVKSFDEASLRSSSFDEARLSTSFVISAESQQTKPLGLQQVSAQTENIATRWMSLFTASILLAVATTEFVPVAGKTPIMVAIFAGFLLFHPSVRLRGEVANSTSTPPNTPMSTISSQPAQSAVSAPVSSNPRSHHIVPTRILPVPYRCRVKQMDTLLEYYLSDRCQWKLVKSNAQLRVFDTPSEKPFPVFQIETFIAGVPIDKFLAFIRRTNMQERTAWDENVARFETVEDYPNDAVSIMYNAQRAFLGGFISARDFCVLYSNKSNYTAFSSVEHPAVPEKSRHTRGTMHFGCFHCTEQTSETGVDGFLLRYFLQIDVGGSLPVKLLYNGTMETMEKMIKAFHASKKLIIA